MPPPRQPTRYSPEGGLGVGTGAPPSSFYNNRYIRNSINSDKAIVGIVAGAPPMTSSSPNGCLGGGCSGCRLAEAKETGFQISCAFRLACCPGLQAGLVVQSGTNVYCWCFFFGELQEGCNKFFYVLVEFRGVLGGFVVLPFSKIAFLVSLVR